MKYVEIYRLRNDGEQKLIATCKMDGEIVICEGEEPFISNLKNKGITDPNNSSEKLLPKDGLKFLEALPLELRSVYLCASEIKE